MKSVRENKGETHSNPARHASRGLTRRMGHKGAFRSAAAAAALLLAVAVFGQDWPNFQSNSARTGLSTNPLAGFPGVANLNWFAPQGINATGFVRQAMSPEAAQSPGWTGYGPATVAQESFMTYAPVQTGNAIEDQFSGFTTYSAANATNPSTAIDYYAAPCIPSLDAADPTKKLNAGDSLDTFSWKVEPAQAGSRVPGSYALFSWIPVGPTWDPTLTVATFPQRFYVFTITDSAGAVTTDIVDTFLGGTGWIRLGGGGQANSKRTFNYDGVNPIVITLYNTVPRDALGNLTEFNGGSPDEIVPTKLVYADAVMAIPDLGFYDSSPIVSAFDPASGNGTVHTVGAENMLQVSTVNGLQQTLISGQVTSYANNTGAVRWTWSPQQVSASAVYMDTNTVGITSQAPWAQTNTSVGSKGMPYLTSPVTNTIGAAANVTYTPVLKDGSYQIQAWLPGSNGGLTFAQALTYEIFEGTTMTTVTVNQDAGGGWVTLGTRRFMENNLQGNPLSVVVTNFSAQASDATRTAFTDAIQFIGQENTAIESSPVQVTALVTPQGGGAPVPTAVTLVAAEDGRIYCLDSQGDGHGGTTVHWAYPSLPTVNPDPNQQSGLDGPGPTAEMPIGFSLSTAIVETVAGHPYLYIGSTNGRVYCLDMQGRGDTTTTRIWSYPDDYPSTPLNSTLGPIHGSLAFVNDGVSPAAVIVPAQEGRIISLNALPTSPTTRTTTELWSFPAISHSFSALNTWTSAARNPGDVAWTNPPNAQFADQVYATATPDTATGGTGATQYLQGIAPLNMIIPPNATILGIQVKEVRHRTVADPTANPALFIHDANVRLVKGGVIQAARDEADTVDDWGQVTGLFANGQNDTGNGTCSPITTGAGVKVGVYTFTATTATNFTGVDPTGAAVPNLTVGTPYNGGGLSFTVTAGSALYNTGDTFTITTSDETKLYGGETDLWNNTWTPADFGGGFGVAIAAAGNGDSTKNNPIPTAAIDYIEVRVYYSGTPTLGPIVSSPTVAFGDIYFGTMLKKGDNDFQFSGLFAVNQDTGAPDANWVTNNPKTVTGATNLFGNYTGGPEWTSNGTQVPLDNFESGMVAISAAELNTYRANTQSDTLAIMNDNQFLTGIYADGANGGKVEQWTDNANAIHYWATNELGAGVIGSLSYSPVSVFKNFTNKSDPDFGVQATAPLIIVPVADGRFDGIFALNGVNGDPAPVVPLGSNPFFGNLNRVGTKQAWEFIAAGTVVSSMSIGRNFMYGADQAGFLYAFGNGASVSGFGTPGYTSYPPNNPGYNGSALDFRQTKVGFVDAATYQAGRKGTLTYAQLDAKANGNANGGAFDWGQTMYIAIYNFPYPTAVPPTPAIATYQFSITGESQRNLSIQSSGPLTGAPASNTGDGVQLDGYAILPFTLQAGGSNSLAPGPGTVTLTLNTSSVSNPPAPVNVALTPGIGSNEATFVVANPLALVMNYNNPNDTTRQIGYTGNAFETPGSPQNTVNGCPPSASLPGDNVPALTAPEGLIAHGQSGAYSIGVVDRSLMTVLRGPGIGLENVRLERSDLTWQYPAGQSPMQPILNPIPSAIYSSLEDYPINFPNDSLDYPDIRREQLSAVSDPSGQASNPVFVPVNLLPPTNVNLSNNTRTAVPTEWRLDLAVPRYQPPNATQNVDSAGASVDAGYRGQFYVFVDSFGQGVLQTEGNQREAYRSFWVTATAQPDVRFHSGTPNIDLGSLDGGAGEPLTAAEYSPWQGAFMDMFQPFNITNDGNINLIDLRLAKQSGPSANAMIDWPVFDTNGNNLNWLDSFLDVHSNIDIKYPLTAGATQIVLPKARTTDSSPTSLVVNPTQRANPNLGIVRSRPYFSGFPVGPPTVAVSVPFGLPIGTYSQLMRVVENDPINGQTDAEQMFNGGSPSFYDDPSFTLTFHVRETRLTSKPDTHVDPLADNYATGSETLNYANSEPAAFRDLSGNLHVAFISSRPSFVPPPLAGPATTSPFSIYVATLHGTTPSAGGYPLMDLDLFAPAAPTGWFSQDSGPYPTTAPGVLFVPAGSGYVLNANIPPRYVNPAFPATPVNPFNGSPNGSPYMVFVGNAQVTAGANTVTNSKVFITSATVSGTGQMSFTGAPVPLPDSLTNQNLISGTVKQRPTVIQVGNSAVVFYSVNGSGHGQVFAAVYNGTNWVSNTPVAMPELFDSVGTVSVSARNVYNNGNTTPMYELAFQGKLAGRSHADIFFARLTADPNTFAPTGVADLAPVTGEVLAPTSKSGIYQSAGANWDGAATLTINGAALTTQPQTDTATGVVAYDDNILGGKVYLDPVGGTVQFSGVVPPSTTVLQLTYTPRFLRVSSGGSTALYPTILWDNRTAAGSNLSYWNNPNATIATDRYLFTYCAASNGAGGAARPLVSTFRLGLQLPTAVATDSGGNIVNLTVAGSTSFYQIDPVKGRVYFTDVDEGRNVTVTYTGVDAAGNQLPGQTGAGAVSVVPETTEAALPVEGAVNEGEMSAFLDPFNSTPRPGIVWLFWTSTRNGWPDVYFETVAPNFTPLASSPY